MVGRGGMGGGGGSVVRPALEYGDDLEKNRAAKAVQRREAYQAGRNAAQELPGKQEYSMLRQLHAAQEEAGFTGLLAGGLTTSGWDRTYPEHENVPSKIFGGPVVHRAFIDAIMRAGMTATIRPVVVSVDRITS